LGERQEIIEDIEARIAELFSEKLNRNKEVINQADVDNIISVMGSPDNFEEEESTGYSQEKTEPRTHNRKKNKKFYRDPDHRVLGGVCAGASNYFDWDVALVRVIFMLSVIFLGTGVIFYILFWIITPEAKSTSEKLAMKGKKANVDNISSFVTKFKSNFDHIDTEAIGENIKTQSNKFNDFLVGTSQKFNKTLKPKENFNSLINFIFSIIGFIFISVGIALVLSMVYGLIMPENVNQIKMFIHGIDTRLDLNLEDYLPLAIAVFTLITSIGIGLIILGIRIGFSRNRELITKLKPIGVTMRFLIILSL
jgi:phage shock protein PspC (stress-responsive transcriptional regulator)